MLHNCSKSLEYTKTVKVDLQNILYNEFKEYCDSICFLATGSFGKYQMTLESDIDLICILDNNVIDKEELKDLIKKTLMQIDFKHAFEFYPIETFDTWKWIAQYSTLYCSDLFYAVPLVGNNSLFHGLMNWISKHNLEYLNRQSHFIYNLLYREQQLQNPKIEKTLKYQKGGLRDFQFIKWVSRRIYNNEEFLPEQYLLPLCQSNLLLNSEYKMLVEYAESILGYKWDIEEGRKDNSESRNVYEEIRGPVAEIVEKLKEFSFRSLFVGSKYQRLYDTKGLNSCLKMDFNPESRCLNRECMVLGNIWGISDEKKLEKTLQECSKWWSIRAAVALNPHCSAELLNEIIKLKYPDMSDIEDFVLCNLNYKPR